MKEKESKQKEIDKYWIELMDLCKKADVNPSDCKLFSLIGNEKKLQKIIEKKQKVIDLVNSWLVTIDLVNSNPDLIETLKQIADEDEWIDADELGIFNK